MVLVLKLRTVGHRQAYIIQEQPVIEDALDRREPIKANNGCIMIKYNFSVVLDSLKLVRVLGLSPKDVN